MQRISLLLLGLAGISCTSGGLTLVDETTGVKYARPSHRISGHEGTVYASNVDVAARALQHMELVTRPIERLLDTDAAPPEVWILEEASIEGRDGLHVTTDRGGFLLITANSAESFDYLLTHELAHWYSESIGVELPLVVEEGLADMVTLQLIPELMEAILWARERKSEVGAWSLEQALHLDFESWLPLDANEEREVRSLGFLVVQNLGLKDLAKLRAEARAQGLDHVPAEWFLGQGPGAAYPRLRSGARDLPVRR